MLNKIEDIKYILLSAMTETLDNDFIEISNSL